MLFQVSQGAALVLADNALNLRIQVFLHFEYQMSSTHRYCFSWSCSLAGSTLTGNFSMKLVVGIFRTFTFFKIQNHTEVNFPGRGGDPQLPPWSAWFPQDRPPGDKILDY